MFAVYEDDDNEFNYFANEVDFLVVTESGDIKPFGLCGEVEYLEVASNYEGLYTLEGAKEYFSRIEFSEKSKGADE